MRLFLLTVLLAAQNFSFAHELDHFKEGDLQPCSVCSFSSNLDVLVQVSHEPPQGALEFIHACTVQERFDHKVNATLLGARGPPSVS